MYKQKRAMHRGMRIPRGLILRRYADFFIALKEYLAVFVGEKISDKFCVTELDQILLNSMSNIWSK